MFTFSGTDNQLIKLLVTDCIIYVIKSVTSIKIQKHNFFKFCLFFNIEMPIILKHSKHAGNAVISLAGVESFTTVLKSCVF